jgi:para-nitrobenzyl esterase
MRPRLLAVVALVALVAAACSSSASPTTGAGPGNSTTADTGTVVHQGEPPVLAYDTTTAFVGGDPTVVSTPAGPVHGTVAQATRRFLALPYAAPPVGENRWRAPQPVTPWTAVRDATASPPECTQVLPVVDLKVGQEDCLYLNVDTPAAAPDHLLPVMVWIHGGGFTVGSGNDNPPTRIVERGGVIVVSINYRLGPFGFLAHPALQAEDPSGSLGNMGFLDQVAALQWVHDSIGSFGGDPRNVTIFGESAGAMSVCAHLQSPRSAGLFERAIMESGPCVQAGFDRAVAVPQSAQFTTVLGCDAATDQLACLRSRDSQAVLDAMPGDPTFLFRKAAFWFPTADDVVLPSDATARIAAGDFNRVPVIAGVNRDEGRLFIGMAAHTAGALIAPVTPANYEQRTIAYFGDTVGPKVVEQYPLSDYPGASEALGQAVGDAIMACPAIDGALALAPTVPVYLYQFEHAPNPFVLPMTGIDLGAFHSAELPYVFGGPVLSSGPITFTPAEQATSDAVIDAWTRFARTGDPSGGGLEWPVAGSSRTGLVIDTPVHLGTDLHRDPCSFWAAMNWNARDAGRQ